MIVGTNIGAGVLSIAYASSKAGFTAAVLAGAGGQPDDGDHALCRGIHARTRKHLQLSGLSKRYVGGFGALMMFLSVCVNSVGG
jgi:hypothetical protein